MKSSSSFNVNHEVSLGLRNEWEWLYCVQSCFIFCLFVYLFIGQLAFSTLLHCKCKSRFSYNNNRRFDLFGVPLTPQERLLHL